MSQAAPLKSADANFPLIAPHFEFVKQNFIKRFSSDEVVLSRGFFIDVMSIFIKRIKFDPVFYRAQYPDLAEAEAKGMITDLRDHYQRFGYFEDRLPAPVPVDGAFYARRYPDVAVAILENRTPSAQVHFEQVGFREGRIPYQGWSFSELLLP